MSRNTAAALVVAVWTFGATMALGELYSARVQAIATPTVTVPYCGTEDGSDVDGVCVWVDPDTGDLYVNPTPEEMRHDG